MIGTRGRVVAVLAVLTLLVAACGSSSSDSKDTTTSKAKTSDTKKSSGPSATATPTTGLTAGATVTVTAKGFTPGKQIGINECAQKGSGEVGAQDCDLSNISILKVGPDGTGTGTIAVSKGPIGQAAHTCGGDTRCFLSVGELVQGQAERAKDIDLTFS